MKVLAFLVIILSIIVQLPAITLGDRFNDANTGDFIVFAHDKHVTLFHILEKSNDRIVIEEITVQERFANKITSWHKWINDKAPHHSGWTLSTFQRPSYRLLSVYSYDTHNLLSLDDQLSFLPTLFTLSMEITAPNDRKQIGVPPMPGEQDHRIIWNPPIIFDRHEQKLSCDVYTVTMPNNTPDLSGKKLDLYFPIGKECLDYLPYWIEVKGGITKVKLRAIDSGKNLSSPASHINN